jgi:hypothetical protein
MTKFTFTALLVCCFSGYLFAQEIPEGIENNKRRLDQYLSRFTPQQQQIILQRIAARNANAGGTNSDPRLIIAQAEAEAISKVARMPEVISLRAKLSAASGESAKRISEELQSYRDAAAADGRDEGLRRLAAKQAADAQVKAIEEAVQKVIDQAINDQRIYREAMKAKAAGQPYLINDPETVRRIFGR